MAETDASTGAFTFSSVKSGGRRGVENGPHHTLHPQYSRVKGLKVRDVSGQGGANDQGHVQQVRGESEAIQHVDRHIGFDEREKLFGQTPLS